MLKEILKNDKLQPVLFGLAHAVILLPLFNTVYRMPNASTALYLHYASLIMDGGVPYQDFALEYPPLALAFFLIPRLFASDPAAYMVAFQVEVMIFDLLGLYLIYRLAKISGRTPWKMLAVYSAAILAIGPLFIESYDIFPAILTLLSLYFFITGRHKAAWIILALGFMTKLYPALIAPVYLLFYLKDRQFKRMWTGAGVFAAACLVIALPFLITSAGGLQSVVSLHGSRPLQVETTYSSVLLMIDRFTNTDPQLAYSAGSKNILGPVPDTLATISVFLLAGLLLLAYWMIYRRLKKGQIQLPETGVFALLVVFILLTAGKILSPQYLIWLIPLLPLIPGKKGYIIAAFFIMIGGMTYYIYPWHYGDLNNAKSLSAALLFCRNMLLISGAIMTAVFVYRSKAGQTKPLKNL